MPIGRRNFLKSATMTTLSGGLALGYAELLFGQRGRDREIQPRRPIEPVGQIDIGDNFPIPLEAQREALFYFRASTFSPYVGDIFQAPNALGHMIELKLTRVSEYKMRPVTRIATKKSRQPESFSLTFNANQQLPQFASIHKVSHPALGAFDLFRTSHETADGTFVYEAVFNHIR